MLLKNAEYIDEIRSGLDFFFDCDLYFYYKKCEPQNVDINAIPNFDKICRGIHYFCRSKLIYFDPEVSPSINIENRNQYLALLFENSHIAHEIGEGYLLLKPFFNQGKDEFYKQCIIKHSHLLTQGLKALDQAKLLLGENAQRNVAIFLEHLDLETALEFCKRITLAEANKTLTQTTFNDIAADVQSLIFAKNTTIAFAQQARTRTHALPTDMIVQIATMFTRPQKLDKQELLIEKTYEETNNEKIKNP